MTEEQLKASIRERDGYRCRDCGMSNEQHLATFGRGLDVHRIIPGSVYTLDGCVTACRPCHGKRHRRGRSAARTIYARIDPQLGRLIEQERKRLRITRKAMLQVVLEFHLTNLGLWPPSAAPAETSHR